MARKSTGGDVSFNNYKVFHIRKISGDWGNHVGISKVQAVAPELVLADKV